MESLAKKQILGVNVTNASKKEVLEYIANVLQKSKKHIYIATPNPEMVVLAHKDPHFKSILNNSEIALCDGVGLQWASLVLKKPIKGRITGTDFVKFICERFADQHVSIGLLGGKAGVAERAAECLLKSYPKLDIVYVSDEWGEEGGEYRVRNQESRIKNQGKEESGQRSDVNSGEKNQELRSQELGKKIDILFVALGVPKQEVWMYEHLDKIPVGVMIGVGGAFDYISGAVPRAPFFIRSLGLEWLFRLIVQPWRIKRQLALIEFVLLVLKKRFFS